MPVRKFIAGSPEGARICEPSFECFIGRNDIGVDRTLSVRRLVPLEQDSPPKSPVSPSAFVSGRMVLAQRVIRNFDYARRRKCVTLDAVRTPGSFFSSSLEGSGRL
jgi:hypothetical protein